MNEDKQAKVRDLEARIRAEKNVLIRMVLEMELWWLLRGRGGR